MAKSAYIHIPFCAYKCDFCDFAAFAGVDELSDEYCTVLVDEIRQRAKRLTHKEKLKSVFYGGGTPGYIEPRLLARIHDAIESEIGFEPDVEITMETTPHSITAVRAPQWKEIGINRISIGVQSFHDSELKAMGRDHSREQAIAGITTAMDAGFENLAIDLMYGLPEQTIESWESSLQTALSFGLPHLSAYGLTIEVNSPLLQRYPRDSDKYPNEDTFVEMYKMLIERSTAAGLQHYEISNFAREGKQSFHNLTYWQNDEYLAFGVSAHRYLDAVRSSNFRSLKRYMREPLGDETSEKIDEITHGKEAIFLGLRMRKGLHLQQFQSRYGFDLEELLEHKIRKLTDGGFLSIENGWLKLTEQGILVSNLVLAELI